MCYQGRYWCRWTNNLASRQKTKLTLIVSHHLQMQLSTIHWEFIILCKNGEGITWTQRSMAFSISMPNSSLLRTLNHWHQEIYLWPFFASAQSLLANQANAPVKTFSYTVINCVVARIIVQTYVRSTMRSTFTLKKTAIKLTSLSMRLIWTYLIICSLLFYIVNIVLIIIVESYYIHCCCIYL